MTARDGLHNGGLPDRAPDGLSREEKDRLKTGFGRRLRALLDLTGLSTREFAQLHPAYKDSTIRKYTLGTNLPPWDFLRDLLAEASRRASDLGGESPDALLAAYRDLLVRVGAVPGGSDQNSLLLRLLDGERALRELRERIAALTSRERELAEEIDRLGTGPDSAARVGELTEEREEVARQAAALVRQRAELVGGLDRTRQLLALLREDGDDQNQLPATRGDGRNQLPGRPWTRFQDDSRRLPVAVAAGVTVAVLVVGILVGAQLAGDDGGPDPAAAADTSATSDSPVPETTPSPVESTPVEASEPTPSEPTPEESFSASPTGEREVPESVSLTTFDAIGDTQLTASSTELDGESYTDALVSGDCGSEATYNLSRDWTELSLTAGVPDYAEVTTGSLTITVDGETVAKLSLEVGKPEPVSLDVTGVLRLSFYWEADYNCSGVDDLALVEPMLTR